MPRITSSDNARSVLKRYTFQVTTPGPLLSTMLMPGDQKRAASRFAALIKEA